MNNLDQKYIESIFIFRRDLRLEDNTGLIKALKESKEVICIFIFNPKQVENNPYKGNNSIQFMLNSLKELNSKLIENNSKLLTFYGNPQEVIEEIINTNNIKAVYVNEDYSPFSIERDKKIEETCKKHNIDFISSKDLTLNSPKEILKTDNTPYTIFTPYYNKAKLFPVNSPQKNLYNNYFKIKSNNEYSNKFEVNLEEFSKKLLPKEKENKNLYVKGGRDEAIQLLKTINTNNYEKNRDKPYEESTSKLSAHLKFGTISIRETFQKGVEINNHMFIRQLYWRDFYMQILYHFPKVIRNSFNSKFENLNWIDLNIQENKEKFEKWKEGKTGFPIVDAGMRELNSTGFMHNRVRMITSSFLVKDLHIDWKEGEKYFANKLVDYDVANNNGGWQWVASTGCDAQPYFRIFNPWTQQQKFDPECKYIKKWIPELKDISCEKIHNIWKNPLNFIDYPKPIINHSEEIKITKELYNIK